MIPSSRSADPAPRSRALRPIATTLLMLVLAAGAAAQVTSKRWKSRNDRENRYEGRIEIPVGNPTLEVLSLLGFRESYSGGEELTVRFFVPDAGGVTLRARELEERVQYWMEAKEDLVWTAGEWNEFGPWPTADVLAVEKIAAGNLGVLIHQGEGESTTLLPAFVYHSAPPETFETYTLHFRPGSDLGEITYRLFAGDEELGSDKLVDLDASEPFSIKLEAADLPPGRLRLELTGKPRGRPCGGDKGPRCPGGSYILYHRAP